MDIFIIIWFIFTGLACLIIVLMQLDFFEWVADKIRSWRDRRKKAIALLESCYGVVILDKERFCSLKLFRYEIDAVREAAMINTTISNNKIKATVYYCDNENFSLLAEIRPRYYPFDYAVEREAEIEK